MMPILSACHLVFNSKFHEGWIEVFHYDFPNLVQGSWKSRGPFRLSGAELNHMHWQDQARLHVVLFCSFWLRVLSSISFVNVPDIWGSQVSQPSGQMCLYNDCLSESLSYDEQELQKIFSPLHLGGILVKNLWYLLIAFPLVSKYHQLDAIPVVLYPSSKPAEGGLSFLRTHGQFLYNLYDIPFMPEALPAQA